MSYEPISTMKCQPRVLNNVTSLVPESWVLHHLGGAQRSATSSRDPVSMGFDGEMMEIKTLNHPSYGTWGLGA